jgi:hypothetical protein
MLLRNGRLDLRAPAAYGDPESVSGQDGEAEGLAQGEDGKREEEKCGGGEEERRLPAEGDEVAEGEAGERSEKRDPAEPEGLDDGGVV